MFQYFHRNTTRGFHASPSQLLLACVAVLSDDLLLITSRLTPPPSPPRLFPATHQSPRFHSPALFQWPITKLNLTCSSLPLTSTLATRPFALLAGRVPYSPPYSRLADLCVATPPRQNHQHRSENVNKFIFILFLIF